MAGRWIVVLALLILGAETNFALGDEGSGIPYRVQIVVPGDPSLARQMSQISQLVAREGKIDGELALHRRATDDLRRFEAAARAVGYYDAKLKYDVDERKKPWQVTVTVDLGEPYRLREVKILTPDGHAPPLAERFDLKELGLELGMRAQSAPILAAEGKLQGFYTSRGWPLAKVTGHQAIIDRADRSMHVTYTVVTGESAHFGKTEITGLGDVKRDFVERRIAWKEGELYDSRKVDKTQQALISSNLFGTVRVTPADKVGPDGRIAMTITLTERAARTVGGGLYFDTSLGFGAKAFWEHRNLFGEGELLHLEINAGQSDDSLLAQFKRPDFLILGLTQRPEASYGQLNTAFTRNMLEPLSTQLGSALGFTEVQITSDLQTGVGVNAVKALGKYVNAIYQQTFGYPEQESVGLEARPNDANAYRITAYSAQGPTLSALQQPQPFAASVLNVNPATSYTPIGGSNGVSLLYLRRWW